METSEMNNINKLTLKLAVMSIAHKKGLSIDFEEAQKNYYKFVGSLTQEVRLKYLSDLVKKVKDQNLINELGYNYQFHDVVAFDMVRLFIANEKKFPYFISKDGSLIIHEKQVIEIKKKKHSLSGKKEKQKPITIKAEDIQEIKNEKTLKRKVKDSENKAKEQKSQNNVQERLKWLLEEKERLEKIKQKREKIRKIKLEREKKDKLKKEKENTETKQEQNENVTENKDAQARPLVNKKVENSDESKRTIVTLDGKQLVKRSREEIYASIRESHGLKNNIARKRAVPPRKSFTNVDNDTKAQSQTKSGLVFKKPNKVADNLNHSKLQASKYEEKFQSRLEKDNSKEPKSKILKGTTKEALKFKEEQKKHIYKPYLEIKQRVKPSSKSFKKIEPIRINLPKDEKVIIKSTFEIMTKDKSTIVRQVISRGVPTKKNSFKIESVIPVRRNTNDSPFEEQKRHPILKRQEKHNSHASYEAYMG